ncbi:hypothetical protein EUGRSUZ_K01562 [Eucalyptus grandis]|uniref:Uncharacterized protein n=2 Tax=Eucalyptus grandis TaxID=71139 RepID=A0ACC3IUP1_EUCGR|nr:hypothetical protein EUGRSUZ_K01562 [Eucalyptus grandis]
MALEAFFCLHAPPHIGDLPNKHHNQIYNLHLHLQASNHLVAAHISEEIKLFGYGKKLVQEVFNMALLERDHAYGKVAIITSGASRTGMSTASLFHQHGALVVIADIQDELGLALAAKLGQQASYARCDVSIEANVHDLMDATVANHGRLDIMGILNTSLANLDCVLHINLYGAFHEAKHAARVMVPQRKGYILFTESRCTAIVGLAMHTYAASKHAVVGLTRGWRMGMLGLGKMNEAELERMDDWMRAMGNLKGQVPAPESVVRAALYLASDEPAYVSWLNMVMDGGYGMVNPSLMMALAASRSNGKLSSNA